VIHPFKAVIGHTLGASSALELLAASDAIHRKILPSACGSGPLDAEVSPRLLSTNERGAASHVLKLSAAFGGANAALVASVDEPRAAPSAEPRAVELIAVGKPVQAPNVEAILAATRLERVQLARLDGLSALCVAAAVEVRDHIGDPDRTGVVVGTATATLENNERFDVRLRERGARGVEPRRFPPTSPNLAPGQVSIALGLRGPSLAVGAGLGAALEALLVGYDLVFSGDAERVLIIAAEEVGPAVKTIWCAAGWPVPQHGALALIAARAPAWQAQGARAVLERAGLVERWRAVTAEKGTFQGRPSGWSVLAAVLEQTCP
jgi:3-oxoacyl-[acyl-carrier-protein] synthase-1/3-oxoacyl-[acyl-carrier-protein] synthase II